MCNQQNIYQKDENNGSFSNSLFYPQINNGEQFLKNWLHYSAPKILYLFYFANFFYLSARSNLAKSGFLDCKNIHDSLKIHERSVSHLKCEKNWVETRLRLKGNKTIDKNL